MARPARGRARGRTTRGARTGSRGARGARARARRRPSGHRLGPPGPAPRLGARARSRSSATRPARPLGRSRAGRAVTVSGDGPLAGPLQALLDSPGVTDVLVNSPHDVWVDRGAGLELTDVDLGDAARVRSLAVRLAAAGGARLDDASPVVDARLPSGVRLHAVLPPLAADCTAISLRVPRS